MEFSKEDDNHAKALLPELISRSKKLKCLKNQRIHKSSCVLKVYNSKKKQIQQLKKQVQSLEELCDGLKQKAKSTEIKVSSMTSNIVLYIQKEDKLNQKCQELDQKLETVIEQFEIEMRKVDQQFISASDNYSNKNLLEMTSKIYEEIKAEETAINFVLSGQTCENNGQYDLDTLCRNLTKTMKEEQRRLVYSVVQHLINIIRRIDLSKQRDLWKNVSYKNGELKNTLSELEKTIQELEASV